MWLKQCTNFSSKDVKHSVLNSLTESFDVKPLLLQWYEILFGLILLNTTVDIFPILTPKFSDSTTYVSDKYFLFQERTQFGCVKFSLKCHQGRLYFLDILKFLYIQNWAGSLTQSLKKLFWAAFWIFLNRADSEVGHNYLLSAGSKIGPNPLVMVFDRR